MVVVQALHRRFISSVGCVFTHFGLKPGRSSVPQAVRGPQVVFRGGASRRTEGGRVDFEGYEVIAALPS